MYNDVDFLISKNAAVTLINSIHCCNYTISIPKNKTTL